MFIRKTKEPNLGENKSAQATRKNIFARAGEAAVVGILLLSLSCAGQVKQTRMVNTDDAEESCLSAEETKKKIVAVCEDAENKASAFAAKCETGNKMSCLMLENITISYGNYCGWGK
ncbi:MAG: hypothetical protein V1492_00105 [Candidatus Micrarchaeota archaeon]